MKAAICTKYGGAEVIEVKNIEKPVPKEKEILIKIKSTVVSATDAIFRQGKPFIARFFMGFLKPKFQVLGDAFSGEVIEIGSAVTKYKIGDQVYGSSDAGFGSHAEYICVSESGGVSIKPEILGHDEAAAICDGGLTALPFLRDKAKIHKGQNVLINGASGAIGTMAVQLAKYYGANVTAVCSGKNSEMVKSLGADKVIDYTQEDFTENTGYYDVIFDTVGKSSFVKAKKALKSDGIYMTTVLNCDIIFSMIFNKRAGFMATGVRKPKEKANDLTFFNQLAEKEKIKIVLDKKYKLDDIAEAHAYVSGGHKKGNVVIN